MSQQVDLHFCSFHPMEPDTPYLISTQTDPTGYKPLLRDQDKSLFPIMFQTSFIPSPFGENASGISGKASLHLNPGLTHTVIFTSSPSQTRYSVISYNAWYEPVNHFTHFPVIIKKGFIKICRACKCSAYWYSRLFPPQARQ